MKSFVLAVAAMALLSIGAQAQNTRVREPEAKTGQPIVGTPQTTDPRTTSLFRASGVLTEQRAALRELSIRTEFPRAHPAEIRQRNRRRLDEALSLTLRPHGGHQADAPTQPRWP
jgi:hypothetical protein